MFLLLYCAGSMDGCEAVKCDQLSSAHLLSALLLALERIIMMVKIMKPLAKFGEQWTLDSRPTDRPNKVIHKGPYYGTLDTVEFKPPHSNQSQFFFNITQY